MTDTQTLRGLAFAGGFSKVFMLVGATCVLAEDSERGLSNVSVFAGTSSGAMLAVMLGCGWKPREIANTLIEETRVVGDLLERNPFDMNIISLLWSLSRRRGICEGKALYNYMGKLIAKHAGTGNEDMTFAEARKRFGYSIIVVASCYSQPGCSVFNCFTTPDMPLRTAVRASAGYTGLFQPCEIGRKIYMDGGLTCNYPLRFIDEFHPEIPHESILGFQYDFSSTNADTYAWKKSDWPSMLDIIINSVSILFYRIAYLDSLLTKDYHERTVLLPADAAVSNDGGGKRDSMIHIVTDKPTMWRLFATGSDFMRQWLNERRSYYVVTGSCND
jgi:predicted acylesterase/phospholipase RssA